MITRRICKYCSEEKETKQFYGKICIECSDVKYARAKERYKKRRQTETVKAYQRAYQQTDKYKEYYKSHTEERLKYQNAYNKINKEKIREYNKLYRLKRMSVISDKYITALLKNKGYAPENITNELIKEQRIKIIAFREGKK